jgi:UDP-N-acetylmuramoylalanine--D-glutamate ligase
MQNIPFEFPKGCTFNTLDEIKNKKITIMGLGLNGGGEACVKFFLKHGAYVTVTDMKTQEQLQKTIDSINADKDLDKTKLEYVLGQHRIEDFENALKDMFFKGDYKYDSCSIISTRNST